MRSASEFWPDSAVGTMAATTAMSRGTVRKGTVLLAGARCGPHRVTECRRKAQYFSLGRDAPARHGCPRRQERRQIRLTLGAFLYDPNAHVRVMASQARKPRNIVLLSDGTGNSSAKLMKTNVWRMYEAVDSTRAIRSRSTTTASALRRSSRWPMLGGALGWGLKRNVRTLYMLRAPTTSPATASSRSASAAARSPSGCSWGSSPTRGSSPPRRAAS